MKGLVYKSPLKVDLDLAESYKGNIFLYDEPIKNEPEYCIQDSINLVSKPGLSTFSESITFDDTNHFNIDFDFNETITLEDYEFYINEVNKMVDVLNNYSDSLNLADNNDQTNVNVEAIEAIIDELKQKLSDLDSKLNAEISSLNNEISLRASIESLDNLQNSLNNYALKSELNTKANISDLENVATKDELNTKADASSLNNLATKDELNTKADASTLQSYTTKTEFNNMVKEIQGLFDQLLSEMNSNFRQYAGYLGSLNSQIQEINNTIIDIQSRLNDFALKSEIANLASKDELNQYALKSEIGGGTQADIYPKMVATMKYLGYELPSELKAYRDYNLFADGRLTGDLIIGFKPTEYAGSYGQAWENVAIYNESGEKLTAKYAQIDESGLNIEAVFAKDTPQPKGDSWEAIPSDYVLLDGEVRVSINLGVTNYYGAAYGLRMLNNNPSSYNESFLGASQNYNEWIFKFHNYKPTKFSVTNGTSTYSGYGYMTKYEMRLAISNWSKTLTYENTNYPNNIEVDLTNLNFGSDAKTIELAKAWNIPVTDYDINQDITG